LGGTIVLGSGEAGRFGATAMSARREPARSRAPLAALAWMGVMLLVFAVMSLIGGGGERRPRLVAPTGGQEPAERPSVDPEIPNLERRRQAERKAKSARSARERRRLRERRDKSAKDKEQAMSGPAQASEQAAEAKLDYVPEPAPEPASAPEGAALPAPSPTPPGVEFGM